MASQEQPGAITPGEVLPHPEPLTLNVGRPTLTLSVLNTGDRPIQVGSHYHFFEVNRALRFDRAAAFGFRLDIPAGTAVRFEPGEEKEVALTAFGGRQTVIGLNGLTEGELGADEVRQRALHAAQQRAFLTSEEQKDEK